MPADIFSQGGLHAKPKAAAAKLDTLEAALTLNGRALFHGKKPYQNMDDNWGYPHHFNKAL
jgi:hypothetical protein